MDAKEIKVKRKYKKRAAFTPTQIKELISFVQKNEILYNTQHKEYKNSMKKDELWNEFAKSNGKTLEDVKMRWKNIKEYEARKSKNNKIKLNKQPTGSARKDDDNDDNDNDENDNFQDEVADDTNVLDFLSEVPTEKNTISNVLLTPNETTSAIQFDFIDLLQNTSSTGISDTEENSICCNDFDRDIHQKKRKHIRNDPLIEQIKLSRKERSERTSLMQDLLLKAENQPSTSKSTGIRLHFEGFANSIDALPQKIKRLCERKILASCLEIISQHEDMADEMQ